MFGWNKFSIFFINYFSAKNLKKTNKKDGYYLVIRQFIICQIFVYLHSYAISHVIIISKFLKINTIFLMKIPILNEEITFERKISLAV